MTDAFSDVVAGVNGSIMVAASERSVFISRLRDAVQNSQNIEHGGRLGLLFEVTPMQKAKLITNLRELDCIGPSSRVRYALFLENREF